MKSVWSRPGVRPLLLVVVVIAASACAPRESGDMKDGMPAPAPQVYVDVENNNWADVVVYGLRNGARTRLGMVTSMGRERFVLPSALLAGATDLQLLADPIGGATPYLFPPVLVRRGQRIEVRLENNLTMSSVAVW